MILRQSFRFEAAHRLPHVRAVAGDEQELRITLRRHLLEAAHLALERGHVLAEGLERGPREQHC